MCKVPPKSRPNFDPRGQGDRSRASKSWKHQITKHDKGREESKASSEIRGGRTQWLIFFTQNRYLSDLNFFMSSPLTFIWALAHQCTILYHTVSLCRHFALIIIKNYHVIDSISLIGQIECDQFAKNGRVVYAVKSHHQCNHAGSLRWPWMI